MECPSSAPPGCARSSSCACAQWPGRRRAAAGATGRCPRRASGGPRPHAPQRHGHVRVRTRAGRSGAPARRRRSAGRPGRAPRPNASGKSSGAASTPSRSPCALAASCRAVPIHGDAGGAGAGCYDLGAAAPDRLDPVHPAGTEQERLHQLSHEWGEGGHRRRRRAGLGGPRRRRSAPPVRAAAASRPPEAAVWPAPLRSAGPRRPCGTGAAAGARPAPGISAP